MNPVADSLFRVQKIAEQNKWKNNNTIYVRKYRG